MPGTCLRSLEDLFLQQAARPRPGPSGLACARRDQTLFDNNSNDSGIVSQNFEEADSAIYDAEGADDFTVPAAERSS